MDFSLPLSSPFGGMVYPQMERGVLMVNGAFDKHSPSPKCPARKQGGISNLPVPATTVILPPLICQYFALLKSPGPKEFDVYRKTAHRTPPKGSCGLMAPLRK